MAPCPFRERIQAYVNDQLPEPDMRELEQHVAGCPSCEEAAQGLSAGAGSTLPSYPAASSEGAPPAVAGYDLRGEPRLGGMGAVYFGTEHEPRRPVALKVLRRPHASRPDLVARFEAESQVCASLSHPGIVPVHRVGRLPSPDGRPFYVMKLVEGRTLSELLRQREGPRERLPAFLGYFHDVCKALAYAHALGIVHRDLKPVNIMVGAFGEVQVMDWGLAKRLSDVRPEEAIHQAPAGGAGTQAGAVMGTPSYMAPEQARGEPVDRRADVFGLGAILCAILTGQPPHAGPNEAALRQAARGDIAEATARLRACGADEELVALACRCLSPEKDGRPADAGAVEAAIAAYLAGVQERQRQAELKRREAEVEARTERGRRWLVMGLAAALVLSLVVVGVSTFFVQRAWWQQEAEQARLSERQLQEARSSLDQAEAALRKRRWPEADTALEHAGARLPEDDAEDLRQRFEALSGDLRLARRLDGLRQLRIGVFEGRFTDADYLAGLEEAFRARGILPLEEALGGLGERLRQSPIHADLVAALDDWAVGEQKPETRARLLSVVRRADPDASAWRERARDPARFKDRKALQELAEEAVHADAPPLLVVLVAERYRALGGRIVALLSSAQARHPDDFWLNFGLGSEILRSIPPAELVKPGPDARALLAAVAGYLNAAVALRPDSAFANNNLGKALLALGDHKGAALAFARAEKADPKLAVAPSNLASALLREKRLPEALAACDRALSIDPNLAAAHSNRGAVLNSLNKYEQAEKALREARRLNPDQGETHFALGLALRKLNNFREAEACFRETVRLRPDIPEAHDLLSEMLQKRGEQREAEKALREGARLHPRAPWLHFELGRLLGKQKRYAEAAEAYAKAVKIDPNWVVAHYNLALSLDQDRKWLQAAASYRAAIRAPKPVGAAYVHLVEVLYNLGEFHEALDVLEQARRRKDIPAHHAKHIPEYLKKARAMARVVDEVNALEAGKKPMPRGKAGCVYAEFCVVPLRRYHLAARLYAVGLGDPSDVPAGDLANSRFNAVLASVRAADGKGEDAAGLTPRRRQELRRQALAWLREDLVGLRKAIKEGTGPQRQQARQTAARWRKTPSLEVVRGRVALAHLPEDECKEWERFWAEVAELFAAK